MMVTNWDTIDREHEAELKAVREKTIEECALAAHKAILDNGGTFELAHDAMAAIRALKDKP